MHLHYIGIYRDIINCKCRPVRNFSAALPNTVYYQSTSHLDDEVGTDSSDEEYLDNESLAADSDSEVPAHSSSFQTDS